MIRRVAVLLLIVLAAAVGLFALCDLFLAHPLLISKKRLAIHARELLLKEAGKFDIVWLGEIQLAKLSSNSYEGYVDTTVVNPAWQTLAERQLQFQLIYDGESIMIQRFQLTEEQFNGKLSALFKSKEDLPESVRQDLITRFGMIDAGITTLPMSKNLYQVSHAFERATGNVKISWDGEVLLIAAAKNFEEGFVMFKFRCQNGAKLCPVDGAASWDGPGKGLVEELNYFNVAITLESVMAGA